MKTLMVNRRWTRMRMKTTKRRDADSSQRMGPPETSVITCSRWAAVGSSMPRDSPTARSGSGYNTTPADPQSPRSSPPATTRYVLFQKFPKPISTSETESHIHQFPFLHLRILRTQDTRIFDILPHYFGFLSPRGVIIISNWITSLTAGRFPMRGGATQLAVVADAREQELFRSELHSHQRRMGSVGGS